MREELRDERVLVLGADRERRERERDGQRDVIAGRARRRRARVGGMRLVDPDRAVDQPPKLGIVRARLELQEQPVARQTPAAGHGGERADGRRHVGR